MLYRCLDVPREERGGEPDVVFADGAPADEGIAVSRVYDEAEVGRTRLEPRATATLTRTPPGAQLGV